MTKDALVKKKIVLSGFFRAADLGQQYDTVSRVGGNFSFLSDIHSSVYHIRRDMLSIFPSRLTLVHSTPWDSPVRGPVPSSTSGSLITRCCYPRCILV